MLMCIHAGTQNRTHLSVRGGLFWGTFPSQRLVISCNKEHIIAQLSHFTGMISRQSRMPQLTAEEGLNANNKRIQRDFTCAIRVKPFQEISHWLFKTNSTSHNSNTKSHPRHSKLVWSVYGHTNYSHAPPLPPHTLVYFPPKGEILASF